MDGAEGRTEKKKRKARERIVEVAAELFMERGAKSVSMDEVALAADVARRTLFNYFASKEELLYAAAAPVLTTAIELAEARMAAPVRSPEELVELCLALWDACGLRLGLIYAVELDESPRLAALHARFLEALTHLIASLADSNPRFAAQRRLIGKLLYRCFLPLLLALEGEEDARERFSRGLLALLEGAGAPFSPAPPCT